MSEEPRGQRILDCNHPTPADPGVRQMGQKSHFQLEMETNSWLRIGLAAKDRSKIFNNLLCHFKVANLREAFHALDGSKAAGMTGITKTQYGKSIDENLKDLETRIHRGTYRPLPKRGVFIPKAHGQQRLIAISEFEDKLVEYVIAKTLTAIYEPLFIKHSYGFRPGKSAHDAIKIAYCSLKDNKRPHVVEIDLRSFFDTVSHRTLKKLLKRRLRDKRLLGLIGRFLEAGILNQQGELNTSDVGTPQGSIMSPVLANVFLHYALDEWFLENYAPKGGIIIRYADDAIFIFEDEQTAESFKDALKERLSAFGLKLNEDKSGRIHFDKRGGEVFHFLGFTFYWGKDRGTVKRVLRVKTKRDQLFKKIQQFTLWIKKNRSRIRLNQIWDNATIKLRGHYEYYGVHTNRPALNHFYYAAVASLFKWLNRRSQKRSFTWEQFNRRLIFNPLPKPPEVIRLKSLTNRRYCYA